MKKKNTPRSPKNRGGKTGGYTGAGAPRPERLPEKKGAGPALRQAGTTGRGTGRDKAGMGRLLARAGIRFSEAQLEQLWSYHNLLREHNTRLNMTRIHNFTNMVEKLYVDSILPGMLIKLPSPLLDIGTGAGMPGIPLAIAFPDIRVVLAESRQNRVQFLETAVREIGLPDTTVEGKTIHPRFDTPVSGIITRAVEPIERTLGRVDGCLARGGLAVFMKGPGCADEIRTAETRFSGSYRLSGDMPYTLPRTPHHRRLVVFERKRAPLWQVKENLVAEDRLREIESPRNTFFRDLKKLLDGRGVKKQQQALIAGEKIVSETLSRLPDRCIAWISGPGHPPPEPKTGKLPRHMMWYRLTPERFGELDVFGTDSPLLLIHVPAFGTWRPEDGFTPGCTVLIPFQDPENVGTMVRSAVAFGATGIILLSEAAHPFHPKAIRASGGAALYAEFCRGPSINDLPPDLPLVCLSGEGRDIREYHFPEAFGLLPGVEGSGIPGHLRKNAVSIPIGPDVESLNAATAAAIALYERVRR